MIWQPLRAYVGNCAACGSVIIVPNDGSTWPLIECKCDHRGGLEIITGGRLFEWNPPG